jgi:preprotein translocase subunit SecY
VMLIGLGIIVAVVFMDQGQRRIPIQYAKRVVGRRMMGGTSTYLPLKVNQAGVIPIIFATSIMYFPTLIASVYHADWFTNFTNNYVTNQRSIVYMAILTLLIVFFAYFYTAIQFDPVRTADQIRKQGGFIPGIRPGPPTASYLNDILVRITLPGSLFLAAIALIPSIVFAYWAFSQFPFGGTSVLIAVGVALETMKQIESQLLMRHYEGFLK